MEEQKRLTMNLKVDGKSYRVNTTPEKEEVYRLAEQEVKRHIDNFRKGKYKGFEDRDYIAMAALHLAISNVQMRQQREVGSADLKALEALSDRLDACLNDLDR